MTRIFFPIVIAALVITAIGFAIFGYTEPGRKPLPSPTLPQAEAPAGTETPPAAAVNSKDATDHNAAEAGASQTMPMSGAAATASPAAPSGAESSAAAPGSHAKPHAKKAKPKNKPAD